MKHNVKEPVQLGTVIVFKPGTTKEQAKAAIERLKDVIDTDYYGGMGKPSVSSFNPDHGGPVWYVP